MELAIVILNWNAAADTVRCVRDILSWTRIRPTVWVVDNGSTDDSVQMISRELPKVHLIRNSANLGFGGGNNRGIAAALVVGDAPILLMNNDARIAEGDVVRLVETLWANQQLGFVGPLLYDADQGGRLLAAGGLDPAQHHHSHITDLPDGPRVRVVECVPGTVILGRAEVFREVGLLDEDYFYGSEVTDLCLRAAQQGYLSAIDTQARAFHDLERSSAFRDTLYTYYIIRNRFLLVRKFHRQWKLLYFGFWALYSLALSVKVWVGGRWATAWAVWLGLRDGLMGRFGDQNDRVTAMASGGAGGSEPGKR